jgi:hypothetical protein
VPIISNITIPLCEVSGLTVTFTNVFDVFYIETYIDYGHPHTPGISGAAYNFFLDVDGTVSFNQDVDMGLAVDGVGVFAWGRRFIEDRRGLHPAYGGIDIEKSAGEQIRMSELEGFMFGFRGRQMVLHSSLKIPDSESYSLHVMAMRTNEQRQILSERNAQIEAQGSTTTLRRLSELAVPAMATNETSHTTPDLSTASTWAHESITRAIELGLVPQSLQGNYTQQITRAEFTALAVALYENQSGEITGREQFTDTNDINVQKAAYLGIVQGVGNDRFDPNAQLTREQAAVMLSRLADVMENPLPSQAATFVDNSEVSSWAIVAVGHVQAAGIMGGVGDYLFDPHGAYTREQSIITILRLFDLD